MIRTFVTLVVAVALLAACGSSELTPVAYRVKMNSLCAQAEHKLGGLTPRGAPGSVTAQKALSVFRSMLTKMDGVTPPASFASGHTRFVSYLETLVSAIQNWKPPTPRDPHTAYFLRYTLNPLVPAAAGARASLRTLHLTTCSKLLPSD